MLKTVSNLSLGFSKYGMINVSILSGAFPRQQPPKGEKRGHLFNGMMPRLKTVSNLPLGFPEYRMTNANNFRRGFPPASNPQMVIKGGIYLWE